MNKWLAVYLWTECMLVTIGYWFKPFKAHTHVLNYDMPAAHNKESMDKLIWQRLYSNVNSMLSNSSQGTDVQSEWSSVCSDVSVNSNWFN